jgi:hypothetical protein
MSQAGIVHKGAQMLENKGKREKFNDVEEM